MLTKTMKWGNSLAVRIPKVIGMGCGLEENSSVEISLRDKQIIIMPVKKEYSLKELLSGVTKDNIHSEFDTGQPVGKEVL